MKCIVLRFMSLVMLLTHVVTIKASLNNVPQVPREQDMTSLMAMLEKMTKGEGNLGGLHDTHPLSSSSPDEGGTWPVMSHDELRNEQNRPEQRISSREHRTQKTNNALDNTVKRLGDEGQQRIEYLKDPFINLLKSSALTHLDEVIARQENAQRALTSFTEYIIQQRGTQKKLRENAQRSGSPLAMPSMPYELHPANEPEAFLKKESYEQPAAEVASSLSTGPIAMPNDLAQAETFAFQPHAPDVQSQSPRVMPLSTTPYETPLSTSMVSPSSMPSPEQNNQPSGTPAISNVPPTPDMSTMPDMPNVEMPRIETPSGNTVQQATPETPQQPVQNVQPQPLEMQQSYNQGESTPPMPAQETQMPSVQPEQQVEQHFEQPEQAEEPEDEQQPISPQEAPVQPEPEEGQALAPENSMPESSEIEQPLEQEQPQGSSQISSSSGPQ